MREDERAREGEEREDQMRRAMQRAKRKKERTIKMKTI